MKNLIRIFCFSLFSVFTFSCTQTSSPSLLDLADYYYLGDIHNEYMLNAAVNFYGDENLTQEEAVQHIKQFNIDFTPSDLSHNNEIEAFSLLL